MILNDLRKIYTHIKLYVVLAYLPQKKGNYTYYNYLDTIYPNGLEKVPPKFAIIKRNEWMIDKSDIVVTYVKHDYSCASTFKTMAEKCGKRVINIE